MMSPLGNVISAMRDMTLPRRLELLTLRLTASRSNQLSEGGRYFHLKSAANAMHQIIRQGEGAGLRADGRASSAL